MSQMADFMVSPIDRYNQQENAIDDWLPITSSRKAKWWYSTVHNVTAMVGAGVLALPSAMSALGWGPGLVMLVLSWVITLYTLWQMVEMHEMAGNRFDRYHELGQYAFGPKLGLWVVVPQQLLVDISVDIVYMVTGGQSLKKFHDLVVGCGSSDEACHGHRRMKQTYFILIFGSTQFVLSQLPNFNSIAGVSLAAAVMSLSYSTIAWGASVHQGKQPDVEYGYRAGRDAHPVFNFFGALGTVAFAYAGHNVVLEIQAGIPSTPEKPSKEPMMKGVLLAYAIVALCYFPVAIAGYWAFGNQVNQLDEALGKKVDKDNILIKLNTPTWLIALANMMVVVHVIGSYQVYAMPVFDTMETVLVKKLHLRPSRRLRLIARSAYVAFTLSVAVSFPFFGALLSFFGSFVVVPTTYFIPCAMWLAVKKPRKFSRTWIINWICIIIGVLLMIVAPIGGLWKIIHDAKNDYKFFS